MREHGFQNVSSVLRAFFAVAYFLRCREEACAQDKSTNGQMCARDSTFSCRSYRACIA